MITIDDKSRCSGCTACVNGCPVKCISMKADSEGFLYPSVDQTLCIGCGRCLDICPYNSEHVGVPLSAYAVRAGSEPVSSSGGAVAAIASRWVADGGCVYGAAFDDSLQVCHIKADSQEDLRRLNTSKYVQSRLDDTFEQIRGLLTQGHRVLFIGTPCQVAGLKSFVGHNTSLLTVQIACHGVPSPKLWNSYLTAMEKTLGGRMQSVNFRDKSNNWKCYNVAYRSCAKELKVPFNQDTYMLAYLQHLSLRPSCYECEFRGTSCADVVAGDLWNADVLLPDYFDGKGFTLIAVYTESGQVILDKLNNDGDLSYCVPVNYASAVDSNPGFGASFSHPKQRQEFFSGLYCTEDVMTYMNAFIYRIPKLKAFHAKIHSILSRIKKKILR